MDNEKVGYKKPPRENQFKPGQSGNPNGRPKAAPNFNTVIESELNQMVSVTEGGRKKRLRKRDVIAKTIVNKAAAGDNKTLLLAIGLIKEIEAVRALKSINTEELNKNDLAIFENLKSRLLNDKEDINV